LLLCNRKAPGAGKVKSPAARKCFARSAT
jgi:hypothetical protein